MSLPFKYKGQEKRIPTSWDDLTVGQVIDLIEWSKTGENDMVKLASIASGIEVGELKEMKVEAVTDVAFPLYQLVIHDNFDKEDWTCPPSFQLGDRRYSSYQEIGNLKYGCMDIFEKTIADESTTLIEKIPLIIASVVYEGKFAGRELEARKDIETLANEGVMNMPIKFAYPIATFFEQIRTFSERSSTEGDGYTNLEIKAGIKDLERFGKFGSVYSLSGGDPLKFSQVLDLTMYETTLTFKFRAALDKFRTNYHRLSQEEAQRKQRR